MMEVATMKRFNTNNEPKRISSREVADMMGVKHKDLLEKIDKIDADLVAENSATEKYWTLGSFSYNGRDFREYQVTKRGCEFLAHKTTGAKGNLFTDKYMDRFDEMEQMLDVSMLPPEMQMFKQIFDQQARMYLEAQQTKEHVAAIETKVDKIRDVVAIDSTNWREDTNKILRKIGKELGGEKKAFMDVRIESYDLLNRRMGVKIETRLENKRKRMIYEGYSRTQCNRLSLIDIIEEDKKLIEGYVAIVKELAIKYGVA